MDRKMDSGCLEHGETMEDEYDFCQTLLPEEIIGIIDQLLCHEVMCLDNELFISITSLTFPDGLAYGTPTCTNSIHKSLRRQAALALPVEH